ncbi:MAG: deoxynucleoside kinase [Nitrosomonas sp.]|nr:deoxynucleoside kinase [Nitrosomonas sp.]MDP1951716.1 deoxynucleoside kinase [Nitrosomonas sp.]
MMLDKYRYIAIEGPIGSGKTSLAKHIANHFGGSLLLEEPNENPFLKNFYDDIPRYALSTQLFFLFQRANQIQKITQTELFSQITISDFLLEKDPLFAELTLSAVEYRLYQQIYDHFQPLVPVPDLVIYLQASPEILIERVKQRGNAFEKNISAEYLWRLSDSYTRFFHQYEKAPVMIVNSENLNFADNPGDFNLLLQRIEQMRSAKEYFNYNV